MEAGIGTDCVGRNLIPAKTRETIRKDGLMRLPVEFSLHRFKQIKLSLSQPPIRLRFLP